jgi:3-oxoacyl-[acyl-carrier protein] reductase
MDLQLDGRVALVTGGSRGIGAAAARLLAREGARVAITYRSSADAAREVAEAIGGLAVPLDLSDTSSIRPAVDAVLARWGRIDVLVGNAMDPSGLTPFPPTPFEDLPTPMWQRFLRTNVDGPIAVAQAVVPAMREQGSAASSSSPERPEWTVCRVWRRSRPRSPRCTASCARSPRSSARPASW